MPPLCTAGYGLAIRNWEYFLGAMYLFTINTIFIALATFLVLKLLRFPMIKYANSKKRTRIGRIATLIAIAVMIPASITFWNVLKESQFDNDAQRFIDSELEELDNSTYIKQYARYKYLPEDVSYIEITTFGSDKIDDGTRKVLEGRFKDYPRLVDAELRINQATFKEVNNLEYMEELRSRDSLDLLTQQQKINFLEDKVAQLSKLERDQIPFQEVLPEVRINFENLEKFAFSNEIQSDFKEIDTLKVFNIRWIDSLVTEESKQKDSKRLYEFLKERLELDTLVVKSEN
jgi:Predicted membrane protein